MKKNKKQIYLLIVVMMLFSLAVPMSGFAESEPSIDVVKAFGGTSSDFYSSVTETSDGEYIAVGYSSSADNDLTGLSKGDLDAIVIKYDTSGNVLWNKVFGGTGADTYGAIINTIDGGYVAVGTSNSNNGDLLGISKGGNDATIVKYDSTGSILWKKTFGGSNNDYYRSVTQTSDGGYLAVGDSNSISGDMAGLNKGGASDGVIVKYDSNGTILWKKSFGGAGGDSYYSVIKTTDGGYVAVGFSGSADGDMMGLSNNTQQAIIVKYTSTGSVLWKKAFGGTSVENYQSVTQTSDGGYVAVGRTASIDGELTGLSKGSNDALLVKYDSGGNILWKNTFGGSLGDYYLSVARTMDGGWVAVGYSASTDGDLTGLNKGSNDGVIVKYNSSGNILWVKTFGGSSSDVYYSVTQTVDGGYVAVGQSSSTDGELAGLNKGVQDAIIVKYQMESIAPTTPIISANITFPTNSNVTIAAEFSNDSTVKQFSQNGGAWTNYTEDVIFSENGTVSFKSQNSTGNWSEEVSYSVTNIDKVAPESPFINLLVDDIISLSDYTDNASGVLRAEYRIDGGAWITYENQVTLLDKLGTEAYIVEARTLDMAGNCSSVTSITFTTFKQKVTVATNKVSVAEISKKQTDINTATTLVNALPDGVEKSSLLSRLNSINIEATTVVSKEYKVADTKINLAMSLPREPYISLALLAIEKVTDPVEKAALVAEMQIAIEKSTASKPITTKTFNLFVRLAEITGRDKYIVLAETKTEQVIDEAEKQDAITRIDIAKLIKSPAEKRAYSALIAAEQWKSTNIITAATKLINVLPEGTLKPILKYRLFLIK